MTKINRIAVALVVAAAAAVTFAILRRTPITDTYSVTSGVPQPVPSIGGTQNSAAPPTTRSGRIKQASAVLLDFGRAEDLSAFVAANLDRAKSGDPEAERLIARAYEECKQLGPNPADYSSSMKSILKDNLSDRQATTFDQAIARETRRCGSLINQAGDVKSASIWYQGAAANGDLAAEVRSLSGSMDMAPVSGAIQKIVSNSDGSAMAEVGNLLGSIPDESRSELGVLSGDRMSAAAWHLASCDFGADCSAGGEQLRDICIRAARCDLNSLEDAYAQLYSPMDLQRAMSLRDQILIAINNGDTASLASEK